MSEACGPASRPSILVLERKRSHGTQVQYGLVPKLRHPKWQKHRLCEPEKQAIDD